MKRILYCIIISIGLISCGPKKKEITQAEFKQLYLHDSIQSLSVYDEEVKAQVKSADPAGEARMMKVESTNSFKASLQQLDDSMQMNNIPNGCNSVSFIESKGKPFFLMRFLGIIEIAIFLAIFILLPVTLISLLKSKFETSTDKLIWVLVVIFIPLFGPLLYWFIGRKQRIIQ